MLQKNNVLVLMTHGTYYIPNNLKINLTQEFLKDNERLLKNFSDFGTQYLLEDFENKIVCNYSRALGDPNRDIEAGDLFMDYDFNGVKIWKKDLTDFQKKELVEKFYNDYHSKIEKKIKKLEEKYRDIIILDIHDTGNLLMGRSKEYDKQRDYCFPEISLGNFQFNSCSKEFGDKLKKLIQKEFGFIPKINWPYEGGFITKKYGVGFENRNVVQIELGRYLYIDEKTQKIDFDKIKDISNKLEKVINNL